MDKNTITTLRIRNSGEDYEVYLCLTEKVAESIIRHWFTEYCTDNPSLGYIINIKQTEVVCE